MSERQPCPSCLSRIEMVAADLEDSEISRAGRNYAKPPDWTEEKEREHRKRWPTIDAMARAEREWRDAHRIPCPCGFGVVRDAMGWAVLRTDCECCPRPERH